jgi:pyridoxine/pyridoxamine 5'-phosphate oxidase
MPKDNKAETAPVTNFDPIDRFQTDRELARKKNDPMAHVCVLATVDHLGRPQVRTLVLRDVEYEGQTRLAIFVNANSPKWDELSNSPSISIQTYWPATSIQYRIQATTQPLDAAVIAASWQFRPNAPKKMDWLYQDSTQSAVVASREALLLQLEQIKLPEPLIAPDAAKGLVINALEVERLDLSQTNGVHDRQLYQQINGAWNEQTLIP